MKKTRFLTVKKNLTGTGEAPRGKDNFYRCGICEDYISSQPKNSIGCKCHNISIDVDYIHLFVRDFAKFTVVRKTS
jgi:hypothetical protein